MKHIRLFEGFSNIDSICKKYGITNYTINSDGNVDVDGNVDLSYKGLSKLPLKFGKVGDFFDCSHNKLTTLEGGPSQVGGDFYCGNNKLITLEGGPSHVSGDFYCYENQLTSLEGCPSEIGGDFDCDYNPIHQVYRLFKNYNSFKDSLDYGYLRGMDIVKYRFKEALEEAGIEIPDKIEGYNWI